MAEIARQARAVGRREKRQGEGFVVASMFEQLDADMTVAARQRPRQPEPRTKTQE